jgi:hypothetical protein
MFKAIQVVCAVCLTLALVGCGGTAAVSIPTDNQETLLWSSAAERPGWTINEPETVGGVMSFVGLSNKFATEKAAREDARRNASGAVVKYMGTLVKEKWERAATSMGLDGDVINPTAATREFQKQMAVNMASKVKVKSWYIEKWSTPTGTGHLVYALAKVPETALDETQKQTAKSMARAAEQKAKAANDEIAKQQAEKAAEFWKQMQESGVTE